MRKLLFAVSLTAWVLLVSGIYTLRLAVGKDVDDV